ncbi:MAG: hypothetical protein ACI9MR_004606 [Myxococcota bacterium]|jgi:hypothetical protein
MAAARLAATQEIPMRFAPGLIALGLVAGCFPSVPEEESDSTDTANGEVSPDSTADTAGGCATAADCQHLAGSCIEVLCLDSTCATRATDASACDDGVSCTKDDTCTGFVCAGEMYACDDGLSCTDNVCDGEGGCDYPAAVGFCHIGADCFTTGDVNAADPCRVCVSGESWSPNDGAPCDDGDDVCSIGDACEGLNCKPGDPPDDSVSDWETGLVSLTSPALGGVLAVAFTGLGDVLMVTEVEAKGVTAPFAISDTEPVTTFVGNGLFGVRRTPSNTYRNFVYEGFDDADFVGMSSLAGALTIAVNLDGDGTVDVQGQTVSLSRKEAHVMTLSATGARLQSHSLDYKVDAVAHRGALGGAHVARPIFNQVTLDGVGAFEPLDVDTTDTLVLGLSSFGVPATAVQVSTPNIGVGALSICAIGTEGRLVLTTTLLGSATIKTMSGDIVIEDAESTSSLLAITIDSDGTVPSATAPIHNPLAALFRVTALSCRSDGSYVGVAPGLGVELATGRPTTTDQFSATVAAFESDHTVAWTVNATDLIFTTVHATDAEVVVFGVVDDPPSLPSLSDKNGSIELGSARTYLIGISNEGIVRWTYTIPNSGALAVVGHLDVSPNGTLAAGGFFIGNDLDLGTEETPRALSGGSIYNPFAATFNSAQGLVCAGE